MKTNLKNKYAISFYKSVEKNLICFRKRKTSFLRNLEDSLIEFSKENPEAKRLEFETCFGAPEDIADEFITSIGGEEIRKKLRRLRLAFILAVVAIFVVSVCFLIWIAMHPSYGKIGYIWSSKW